MVSTPLSLTRAHIQSLVGKLKKSLSHAVWPKEKKSKPNKKRSMSDILYHIKFQMDERVKHSNHENTRRSHKKKKQKIFVFVTPWTAVRQASFPVHQQLLEFAQTQVHPVSDAIQPSYPLSSPSRPAFNLSQHQNLSQ